MVKVAGFASLVAFLAGCGGALDDPGPCSTQACVDCMTRPPLGEVGDLICDGEDGWECCATTHSDGTITVKFTAATR
jgi:hypothetical protein